MNGPVLWHVIIWERWTRDWIGVASTGTSVTLVSERKVARGEPLIDPGAWCRGN